MATDPRPGDRVGDPGNNSHHEAIRHLVASHPDQSLYHRDVLLWIHENGANGGQASNLPAWTLAGPRRGLTLTYQLFGVVVTGRTVDGAAEALDGDLAQQVRAVAATTLETILRWQGRPPRARQSRTGPPMGQAST